MNQKAPKSAKHVVWPGLVRRSLSDGSESLHNPAHGTTLRVDEESSELVEAILTGFARPTVRAEFERANPELPVELLTWMIRSCFVVAEAELPFLEHGFLRPVSAPIGSAWAFSDLPEQAALGSWVVIGAPVDMSALGAGGARHGPGEIRKAVSGPLLSGDGDVLDYELGRMYPNLAPQVADLGDIDPEGGRMDHVGQRLHKVVRDILMHGMRPLVLGGDHSVSHYVLDALCAHAPRFGILHFDAHADLGPSRTLSHANVFEAALASEQVQRLVQIGPRMVERVSAYATRVPCEKRTVVSARQAARGDAMRVLESLPRDIPYYLTFDIDCIDAAIVRETGTPAFGGLSVELATELVDYIARSFELLGADFVEVAAPQGPLNAAASISAALLARCVIGNSAFEPLSTDRYSFGP